MSLEGAGLRRDIELKKCTSIKIGGRAKYFFQANTIDDLTQVISDIGAHFYLLGAGSNLLIADTLIQRPVIKLGKGFSFIKEKNSFLEAGAATYLSGLMKYCLGNNLAGLENLIGIPATVGGLLIMNASSRGEQVSFCLDEVDVMDSKGNIKTLKKEDVTFGYRFSSLEGSIILMGRFRLSKEENLRQKAAKFLKERLSKQDFSFPSCGCVFKNPQDAIAGELIDFCGLKGLRKGDAQVSRRHANFIINLGCAKYSDVDYLIRKIKDQVYKKYNIILEEEIKRWT